MNYGMSGAFEANKKCIHNFCLKGGNRVEDLGVERRIILKWILGY
jgi:hypothetical protein